MLGALSLNVGLKLLAEVGFASAWRGRSGSPRPCAWLLGRGGREKGRGLLRDFVKFPVVSQTEHCEHCDTQAMDFDNKNLNSE